MAVRGLDLRYQSILKVQHVASERYGDKGLRRQQTNLQHVAKHGAGGAVINLAAWEIEIGGRFLEPQNFRVCSGRVSFFLGPRKKVTVILRFVTEIC